MSGAAKRRKPASGRGGVREGAGRKPLHGQAMIRKGVMLDQATVDLAEQLGNGNLSEGIRRAVQHAAGSPPYRSVSD